ncbi:hypothetical protein Bpfe_005791 [Biomphalaria pfeifferi]|uniref:Uncharacterized protein n=1 Tax=Biomphalaria pfeifferi TaxID=112525 RepID=A0AAD8C2T0_BIOPF|nr:hypothetical protein Bpfe_005791 [Biomphalaria pfeifferi]
MYCWPISASFVFIMIISFWATISISPSQESSKFYIELCNDDSRVGNSCSGFTHHNRILCC